MLIAVSVIAWLVFGLMGACGRAFGMGYTHSQNTSLVSDFSLLLLGPIGAVMGLTNAFSCLGSAHKRSIK